MYNGFGEGKLTDVILIEADAGSLVDEVLDEETVAFIYANMDESKFRLADYGGGEQGLTCEALMDACEGKHTVLRKIVAGMTIAQAKNIIEGCQQSLDQEPYQ